MVYSVVSVFDKRVCTFLSLLLFVRDGKLSVADYNSTRVGVVVVVVVFVVVVVADFTMG